MLVKVHSSAYADAAIIFSSRLSVLHTIILFFTYLLISRRNVLFSSLFIAALCVVDIPFLYMYLLSIPVML